MPTNNSDDETSGDDDGALFRRLMGDAKRLRRDTVPPPRQAARPKAAFARRDRREILKDSLAMDRCTDESLAGESLRYQHPSVSRTTMRRLARGGYRVQATIDLHGMTRGEAKDALQDFVADALTRGFTCVRIVHGKGRSSGREGPVLKRAIGPWLRHWQPVLAFVSAQAIDGGTGALYVLLRRSP
jgi:DNA-nicking Smr family endonuclease